MQTEFKVEIPEGMEIDRINSTFECIKFKPKTLTYKDIQNKYLCGFSNQYTYTVACHQSHHEKLTIHRQLYEIADFFNNGWKPNWDDSNEEKFSIAFDKYLEDIVVTAFRTVNYGLPLFKTCADSQKAIDIIGKENLKILFQ